LRIVLHSNAPWCGTGYGQQTALLAPRLRELGNEVYISSFYGLSGKPSMWQDYHVLPNGLDGYGNDVIWGHATHVQADIVIILVDAWVMQVPPEKGMCVVNLTPVDCEPLSMMDEERLKNSGAMPFAISRFGEQMLRNAGLQPQYTPHGIDTKLFAPAKNRLEIRDEIQMPPGAFVIGLNAANKDAVRKSFPEQILAFAEFHERHPDSLLMIHALANSPGALNLNDIILRSGYDAAKLKAAIRFTDQYSILAGLVQPQNIAAWYNSIDLLTNCSYGEGFGLPLIEAQACGTPVVTTNFSAMSELCGSGWLVHGEKFWNGAHRSWWCKPYVHEIVRAYEKAWQARETNTMDLRKRRARRFALQYDADTVMEKYWVPALAAVEKRLEEGVIVSAAGLKWRVHDRHYNLTGDRLGPQHEEAIEQEVLSLLPHEGVFLDVGAHVGHYALRAAKAGATVIAIEPSARAADRLAENLKLNDLLAKVTIHRLAAWDSDVPLKLESITGIGDGSGQAIPHPDGTITGMPLDALITDRPRLDLVKIDTVGSELHVIAGLVKTLAQLSPVLFIQDYSAHGAYSHSDLLKLLASLNYSAEVKDTTDARYIIARPIPAWELDLLAKQQVA
jgi:FkbM family methyltransferase